MTNTKLISDDIGVKEFQDLFKKWVRQQRPYFQLPCDTCPKRFECFADIGCFQTVIIDFLYWLKREEK